MSTGSKNRSTKPAGDAPRSEAAPPLGELPIASPSLESDEHTAAEIAARGDSIDEAVARLQSEQAKAGELGLTTPAADPPAPKKIPKVFAGPCPITPTHTRTRVYNTKGRVRYCCCDDCGHTWKQNGPEAAENPAPAA